MCTFFSLSTLTQRICGWGSVFLYAHFSRPWWINALFMPYMMVAIDCFQKAYVSLYNRTKANAKTSEKHRNTVDVSERARETEWMEEKWTRERESEEWWEKIMLNQRYNRNSNYISLEGAICQHCDLKHTHKREREHWPNQFIEH